jgi:hypothetical protein
MILNRRDPSRLESIKIGLTELAWSDQCGVLSGIVDVAPTLELSARDDLPGSLFLLLEKDMGNDVESYGELELKEELLFFNGERVASLIELVSACLSVRRLL